MPTVTSDTAHTKVSDYLAALRADGKKARKGTIHDHAIRGFNPTRKYEYNSISSQIGRLIRVGSEYRDLVENGIIQVKKRTSGPQPKWAEGIDESLHG